MAHKPNTQAHSQETPWTFDRAAVIGAGPMGTLLAAALGQTMPVVLVCRNPERAAELFKTGAHSTGALEMSSNPVLVRHTADITAAGGASAIFVATKTGSIPPVAADLAPVLPRLQEISGRIFVVSFQNGIDPGKELVRRLETPDVLRMVLTLGAVPDRETGAVRVTLNQPPHAIGSPDAAHHAACDAIAEALTKGGLQTERTDDIESAVWKKALVNAATNPVAALVNGTISDVLNAPSHTIFERLLDEGIAVALAHGVALPEDFRSRAIELTRSASGHLPSMVEDIRTGRESEIGQLNEQIVRHAHTAGVPVPTHEIIDALIKTFDWRVYRRDNPPALLI